MPIWVHLILTILCQFVCCFGGALLGGLAAMFLFPALDARGVGGPAVSFLVAAPLFFGGAGLGLALGRGFAVHCLPAGCPHCGDRTYYREGRPITYHCGACGHVHATPVSTRRRH